MRPRTPTEIKEARLAKWRAMLALDIEQGRVWTSDVASDQADMPPPRIYTDGFRAGFERAMVVLFRDVREFYD